MNTRQETAEALPRMRLHGFTGKERGHPAERHATRSGPHKEVRPSTEQATIADTRRATKTSSGNAWEVGNEHEREEGSSQERGKVLVRDVKHKQEEDAAIEDRCPLRLPPPLPHVCTCLARDPPQRTLHALLRIEHLKKCKKSCRRSRQDRDSWDGRRFCAVAAASQRAAGASTDTRRRPFPVDAGCYHPRPQ